MKNFTRKALPATSPKIKTLLKILFVILLLIFIWGWFLGAYLKFFDFDEIFHAQYIWLVSEGLTPNKDFFDVHPPLWWYIFSPLYYILPESAGTLYVLRLLGGLGNLLFIVALAFHLKLSSPRISTYWIGLGFLFIAIHPAVIAYLVEFRMDSWGYALLLWATYWLRGQKKGEKPRGKIYFQWALLATLSVLLNPKFLFFPPIYFACDFILSIIKKDFSPSSLLGTMAGVGAGLLVASLFLYAMGVPLVITAKLVGLFNWNFNQYARSNLIPLFQVMIGQIGLLVAILPGVLVWIFYLLKKKIKSDPFLLSILVFMALQAFIVAVPYKQYLAPWFLLGGAFLPFTGRWIEEHRSSFTPILALALVVTAGIYSVEVTKKFLAMDSLSQARLINLQNRITPEGSRVAAFPPFHPIFRRDVFFSSYDRLESLPNREINLEEIVEKLNLGKEFEKRFTRDYYRREIRSSPPALVVFYKVNRPTKIPAFTRRQREVIDSFLEENSHLYKKLEGNFGPLELYLKKSLAKNRD